MSGSTPARGRSASGPRPPQAPSLVRLASTRPAALNSGPTQRRAPDAAQQAVAGHHGAKGDGQGGGEGGGLGHAGPQRGQRGVRGAGERKDADGLRQARAHRVVPRRRLRGASGVGERQSPRSDRWPPGAEPVSAAAACGPWASHQLPRRGSRRRRTCCGIALRCGSSQSSASTMHSTCGSRTWQRWVQVGPQGRWRASSSGGGGGGGGSPPAQPPPAAATAAFRGLERLQQQRRRQRTSAVEADPSMASGPSRRSSVNSIGARPAVVSTAARCVGRSGPRPAMGSHRGVARSATRPRNGCRQRRAASQASRQARIVGCSCLQPAATRNAAAHPPWAAAAPAAATPP